MKPANKAFQSPSALSALIESLQCLPGVGPRSAQRMAFHLLQRDKKGANRLMVALNLALTALVHCQRCNNYSEMALCTICADDNRDQTQLCVVETPVDVLMLEQARCHSGLYYVLQGKLSPLDRIGPGDVQMAGLHKRACDGKVSEVILATSYTVEGEATAYFISEMLHAEAIRITRIARGLPVGGELEYVDAGTLAQSVYERKTLTT